MAPRRSPPVACLFVTGVILLATSAYLLLFSTDDEVRFASDREKMTRVSLDVSRRLQHSEAAAESLKMELSNLRLQLEKARGDFFASERNVQTARNEVNTLKRELEVLLHTEPTPMPEPPLPSVPSELSGYRLMGFGSPVSLTEEAWEAFFSASVSEESARKRNTDPSLSRMVIASDFNEHWYADAVSELKQTFTMHRKQWEMASIARVVNHEVNFENSFHGRIRGCGLAVGDDPLPSYFASRRAHVVVTDVSGGPQQRSRELMDTWKPALISKELYAERATFQLINLTSSFIADSEEWQRDGGGGGGGGSAFHFVWSASAMHRLGSISASIAWVLETVRMLRPGGVAVHTTEFVVSSVNKTIEIPHQFTMFRKQDVLHLAEEVKSLQARLVTPDWFAGNHVNDLLCDVSGHSNRHVRLYRDGLCFTTMMLVIKKDL